MVEVVVENISYGLSLYFSYLLPLFDIVEKGDTIVVLKKRGWCSGLKIEVENNRARYTIPKNCSEEYVSMILGLETKGIVDEFFEEYGLRERFNYINNLVIMSSPRDKLMVFTTIFLSRNTDYYRNTVKWVKTIIENDCLSKPMNCLDRIPSYQFRQFMEIHRYLLKYLSDTGKALREAWSEPSSPSSSTSS